MVIAGFLECLGSKLFSILVKAEISKEGTDVISIDGTSPPFLITKIFFIENCCKDGFWVGQGQASLNTPQVVAGPP